MRRVVGQRLLGAVAQVLMVTLLAWLLFYVIARFTGASPAERIAGKNATPQQIALVAKTLGLNKPYWQQYLIFLNHLVGQPQLVTSFAILGGGVANTSEMSAGGGYSPPVA